MGPTFGTTKGAKRPSPGEVPQTRSTSTGLTWAYTSARRHMLSVPWNKGSLWLSDRQVQAESELLKRFKDRCIHPPETSFSHWERVEIYLWGFPTADGFLFCFVLFSSEEEPQGIPQSSKGKQKALKLHNFL